VLSMSIAVNVLMQGDLDNPRHRLVCDEAIQAVVNKHTGNTSTQRIISETKQSGSDARLFDVEGTNPFTPKSVQVEHKLSFYTGFHLNPIPQSAGIVIEPGVSGQDKV
jgi:hypothetical protein